MTMADSNITTEFMMKAIKLEFENDDLREQLKKSDESNRSNVLNIFKLMQEIEDLKAKLEGKGDE
jgi:hypothetical protein